MWQPEAVGQLRRESWPTQVLLLSQLTFNVGFYMLVPNLAGYLQGDLGFDSATVGSVLGVRVLSQQGLFLLGGSIADRIGYRRVIVAGCVIRTVGFLLFGVATSLPMLLVAAILSGFAAALFSPAVQSYLAQEAGQRRLVVFSLFNVVGEVGALLGPVIGALLLQIGFPLISLVAGVLFAAISVGQLRFLPDRPGLEAGASGAIVDDWREVFADRRFILFVVAMSGYFVLITQLYLALPLAAGRFTGTETSIGALFTLASAVLIFGQIRVSAFGAAHWTVPHSIAIGLGLITLGYAPLALEGVLFPVTGGTAISLLLNLAPLAFCFVLVTLGIMLLQPLVSDLIPRFSRDRRIGTYFGVYHLGYGLLAALGNWGVGLLFDSSAASAVPAFPWLVLMASGVASALAILGLDRLGYLPLPTSVISRWPARP